MCVRIAIFSLSLCAVGFAADDETDRAEPSSPAADLAAWTARRLAEMRAYNVTMSTNTGRVTLHLEEQPLLKWSNPLRSAQRGITFVWTTAGRPRLVCCTFPDTTLTTHEFQSLGDVPITVQSATGNSRTFAPPSSFTAMPDAPIPAANRPLRLAQMRRLAGRFSAHVTAENQDTRLLTQPIYRYPKDADVDGAMFAFVQGTDPECLVLFEATEDGWQYRIARMTAVYLRVRLDDVVLREFEPDWQVDDPSYHNFHLDAQ